MNEDLMRRIIAEEIEKAIPEKYRNKLYVRDYEILELKDNSKFSHGTNTVTKENLLIFPHGIPIPIKSISDYIITVKRLLY